MLSLGALLGLLLVGIAVASGAWASYKNVRNARGPRERRFVIQACAIGWLIVFSMLALIYLLRAPYRYYVALAYFIGMPLLIYRWSTTHQLLRMLDERERNDPPRA